MGLDRPPARVRLRAWLVTGPLGHLWGGAADWAALLAHWAVARARGRDPWSPESARPVSRSRSG